MRETSERFLNYRSGLFEKTKGNRGRKMGVEKFHIGGIIPKEGQKRGVISFGEPFIDFIAKDSSNQEFAAYPGGTTLNVAVATKKFGSPVYYLAKFGTDQNSQWIRQFLEDQGINLQYTTISEKKRICQVYVHLDESGERFFHSYVNESEEEHLEATDLQEELFQRSSIFYFGSGTLFHPKSLATTKRAVDLARKHNLIAFDPNIRLKRWESEGICRQRVLEFLPDADVLKLSKSELAFLTEEEDIDKGIRILEKYQVPFLWVTLGDEGAIGVSGNRKVHLPASKVKATDTTGAGDIFMAALLYQIHEFGLPDTKEKLRQYTATALNYGALTVTETGALTAILNK